MNLKLLCVLVLCLSGVYTGEVEDDLVDFDFGNGGSNQTELPEGSNTEGDDAEGEFENDLEYEDEEERPSSNLAQELSHKEMLVRQIMLNSMKSKEMKDNMAKVLPILRVMTPEQRLALATLVTTQVLTPPSSKGLSLDDVSAMFGNNPNTTAELMLPISLDVANLFRRVGRSEKGPTAEELRAPPFKRPAGPGLYRRNIIDRPPIHNNKFIRPRKPVRNISKETPNCELFTVNICLKSHDYPIDAIMSSIRRNKHAMSALLTDVRMVPTSPDSSKDGTPPEVDVNATGTEESEEFNEVRRIGEETGFMCPSIVRYARPQKARATSGEWKYIVNTKEHTQTLRLERCLKAGDSCTYLTDNYKSRCVQVYNYHRLLTWDQNSGLHIDIFKVPTCCSCHIDSYKTPFPPHHANHATTSESFPGEEIANEALEITPSEPINLYPKIVSSNHFRKELPQQSIENYQPESSKIHPSVERPNLPKYLEAPKLPQIKNYNQSFKRLNTPKPVQNSKRSRPLRRRQPTKPVRDLSASETNVVGLTTESPVTTTSAPKEFTKKINYNYHPIIDFFKPDQIESRMDINLGDSDWKPVTSMLLVTERSHLRKR